MSVLPRKHIMSQTYFRMTAILFRTDGNAVIGTGHVMRCLALAQVAQECGHTPVFLGENLSETLVKRLAQENVDLRTLTSAPYGSADLEETLDVAKSLQTNVIVIDGYGFHATYQTALRNAGCTLLFIDDYGHCDAYDAQFVLNQNISSTEEMYKTRTNDSVLLLGTRYGLLRKEFRDWSMSMDRRVQQGKPLRIVLTFGGADPENATGTVLRALQGLGSSVEATVIVGGCNPHKAEIESVTTSLGFPVQMIVNTAEMPRLMAEADLAICAGGSSCYELAYMRLPMVTVVLAENQRPVAAALEQRGCSINMGDLRDLRPEAVCQALQTIINHPEQLMKMVDACNDLVDGYGAERVLMRFLGQKVRLRDAGLSDARMLWDWANDTETRKASFSSEEIPWETHRAWYEKIIHDPNHYFWIAVDGNEASVGSIRFALQGNEATLSISIAPHSRGQGFGAEIVMTATKKLLAMSDVRMIHAYVKPENTASSKLFRKTGFTEGKPVIVKGHQALHFTMRKMIT